MKENRIGASLRERRMQAGFTDQANNAHYSKQQKNKILVGCCKLSVYGV